MGVSPGRSSRQTAALPSWSVTDQLELPAAFGAAESDRDAGPDLPLDGPSPSPHSPSN
jgi:hypothetical protein